MAENQGYKSFPNEAIGAPLHKSQGGALPSPSLSSSPLTPLQVSCISAYHAEPSPSSDSVESSCVSAFCTEKESSYWHAALVKRNYERLCRDQLDKLGLETYLASQKETHIYKNRTRREVEKIIIPNIVFIRIPGHQTLQVMKSCSLIQGFLRNKAAQTSPYGQQPMAIIPDQQMKLLQFMLYHAEQPVNFTNQPLRLGDRIRVVRGQLAGLEGQVLREGKNAYIVVSLDILGSAITSIALTDVEKAL